MIKRTCGVAGTEFLFLTQDEFDNFLYMLFVMNLVPLHTLSCQALTTDMFDLCSQIKYLPQPIQS